MNTKELARYLGINEKKIYTLITEKGLPATKVTGKWLFVKELVDLWIEQNMENHPSYMEKLEGILMLTGSNDLLLDLVTDELKKQVPTLYPYISYTGSLNGLKLLKKRKAHISGCHLSFEKLNDKAFSSVPMIFVNFAYREQGLILPPGNPFNIRGIEDLTKPGVKFVNRQKGSGTRILLDTYLEKYGIPPTSISGYENEVITHFEVGMAILKKEANIGLGIRAIATLFGLSFVPLKKERFDIAIPKDYLLLKQVQNFLEMIRSDAFRKKALSIEGYDPKDAGKIVYITS